MADVWITSGAKNRRFDRGGGGGEADDGEADDGEADDGEADDGEADDGDMKRLEATMPTPETTIPKDPLTLAIAAHQRAIAFRARTRLPDAERACRRALALYTRAEGRNSPDVANAWFELGAILEARDRLRQARQAYGRARAILGPPRGGKNVDADVARLSIQALTCAAGIDRQRGAYPAAERGFRAALAETRRIFGPRDLDVASLLNNLGVLRTRAVGTLRASRTPAVRSSCVRPSSAPITSSSPPMSRRWRRSSRAAAGWPRRPPSISAPWPSFGASWDHAAPRSPSISPAWRQCARRRGACSRHGASTRGPSRCRSGCSAAATPRWR